MRLLSPAILYLVASLLVLWSVSALAPSYALEPLTEVVVSDTLATDSLKVRALLAEGDVFYKRLDNRLAITSYRKAFEMDSTSFDVLFRLARTANDLGKDLQAEGEDDEAEQVFLEAISYAEVLEAEHPDNPKTHYLLALTKGNLALFQGGRQKVAFGHEIESHCQKGLALDSTDAQILVAYGVFNREAASSSWMERAFAQALFGRVPEGSKETAVQLLSRAVALRPKMHVARFELAIALLAVGQTEQAIIHLKETLSLPAQTTQDNRNRQLAARMLDRMRQ